MSGDVFAEGIGPLCAFYRKLPPEITALTVPQFYAAIEAMNEHNRREAGAASD